MTCAHGKFACAFVSIPGTFCFICFLRLTDLTGISQTISLSDKQNMHPRLLGVQSQVSFQEKQGLAKGPGVQEGCSSSCGELQDIGYPFRLKGDPDVCGDPRYELVCNDNRTILEFSSGRYFVINISYKDATIQVVDAGLESGSCSLPIQSLPTRFPPNTYGFAVDDWTASFFNCSKKIENKIYRLVPCLSHNNRFVYVASGHNVQNLLPSCTYITMFHVSDDNISASEDDVFHILRNGFILSWGSNAYTKSRIIHQCLRTAKRYTDEDMLEHKWKKIIYPFQFEYEFVECIKKTWHVYDGAYALYRLAIVCIVFTDIAAFLLVLSMLGRFIFGPLVIYIFLACELPKIMLPVDTVEKFLLNQQNLVPTRFSYTDIIAMTRNFREKIGQGGFGAVFKGELPGGYLVAIKMLGNAKCNGEEFINEVSTIGRIHHVNVVRLVGFCSDGSHRALVYEFMSNGSLDKYIFSSSGVNRNLTMEKLNEIALSVARGIDYLHQGCDMRILHFDIKPHNILLDQNFNPKVSDFGLAKLYPKDYSLVSACAARGTIGYMAPELVSRSFGIISYKSDVYSFGMLLLEMAGGRRNFDRQQENSSQAYYPSWIYDQLDQREKLEFSNDLEIDDVERKLCKVGLWCIQMRPSERPSMSKVIEMLEADADTVDMPPKPFLFPTSSLSERRTSMGSSLTKITTIGEDDESSLLSHI